MRYLGHRTLWGNATWGKPGVVVYAQPNDKQPWTACDPARLDYAPTNFNAAPADCAPAFKRDYIMLDPRQMRLDRLETARELLLMLEAYPLPGIEPLVGMRRLNNYALNFSQMFGFKGWAVVLRHPLHEPFRNAIPKGDELPAPTDMKAALKIVRGEEEANQILNMNPNG